MTLTFAPLPPLSPRALEGLHRRTLRKRERLKARRILARIENKPSFAHAIGRLLENDGLPLAGYRFGFPSDRVNKLHPIHIQTARSLHGRGLVRFETSADGTTLWLTEMGRRAGEAIGDAVATGNPIAGKVEARPGVAGLSTPMGAARDHSFEASSMTSMLDRLRLAQAKRVMPLLGPLLDAWEATPNDIRTSLSDHCPALVYSLNCMAAAMEAEHG